MGVCAGDSVLLDWHLQQYGGVAGHGMHMGRGFLWRHRAAGALARRPFARPRHRAYTDQQPVRSIRSVLIDYRAVLSVLRAPLRHACAWLVRTDAHDRNTVV